MNADEIEKSAKADGFVDCQGRYRRLDQRFVLVAGPFPTHVLFDGEHTRRVIQFFADVFADALKLATAGALAFSGS